MSGDKPKRVNYTPEKDLDLSRAVVNASQTSDQAKAKGTDQKGPTYWTHVLAKHREFSKGKPSEESANIRTWESIKSRFSKKIAPFISKWVVCWNLAENNKASGETKDDIIEKAHKMYQEKHDGETFDKVECWEVLKEMPKFHTMIGLKEDEGTSYTNVGTSLERPGGQKAAKKRLLEKDQKEYHRKKQREVLEVMAYSSLDIARAMREHNAVNAHNQKVLQYNALLKTYQELGMDDKVMEVNALRVNII